MSALAERFFRASGQYLHTLTRGGAWPIPQIHALVYLGRHRDSPVTPTRLSQVMRVRPSSITPMLQRLEDTGLLRRTHSREDRRQVFLTITPEGEKFLDDSRRRLLDFYDSLLERLTPEEALTFLALLEKISDPFPDEPMMKGRDPEC